MLIYLTVVAVLPGDKSAELDPNPKLLLLNCMSQSLPSAPVTTVKLNIEKI
jgi:hypothetical protein